MVSRFSPHVTTLRAAAGVIVTHVAGGEVLMVKPKYRQHWDLPGGCVEPGESPRQAALREVKEELGVDLRVGRLLVVDYLPEQVNLAASLFFIFAVSRAPRNLPIKLCEEELEDWGWLDADDREHHLKTAPLLHARINSALQVKQGFGRAAWGSYLERGQRI